MRTRPLPYDVARGVRFCRGGRAGAPRRRRTSPTAGSRRRSSSRSRCGGRSCSRARRASARPRSRRRSRAILGAELIRLQCYEGIDASQALYEWDYARQLLYARSLQAGETAPRPSGSGSCTAPTSSLERPLLRALRAGAAAVLLIDELDRADDEFEAFLLEILSDFQVTIPEIGTIAAAEPPVVVITSNRTRELHDALKRRCLYHWIDFPELEREVEIIRLRAPGVSEALARSVAETVGAAAGARSRQAARARPRRSTGRRRSRCSAPSRRTARRRAATLGWAVKNQEDMARAEALLRRWLSRSRRSSASAARCGPRASRSGPGRIRDFCRAAALAGAGVPLLGRPRHARRPAGGDPGLRRRLPRLVRRPRARRTRRAAAARRRFAIDEAELGARASRAEVLRRKSFAELSPEELAALADVAARIRLAVPERRTRRRETAPPRRARTCAGRSGARSATRRRAARARAPAPAPAGRAGSCSCSTSPAR